jgi:hypothetical protein
MAVPTVPSSSFVTGALLLFYRCLEIGRVTQKEKEIIEAYASSQYASCFETVARVTLLLNLIGGGFIVLRNVTFMMCERGLRGWVS